MRHFEPFVNLFFPQEKKDEPKSKLIHTLRPRSDTHARTHARIRARERKRGRKRERVERDYSSRCARVSDLFSLNCRKGTWGNQLSDHHIIVYIYIYYDAASRESRAPFVGALRVSRPGSSKQLAGGKIQKRHGWCAKRRRERYGEFERTLRGR